MAKKLKKAFTITELVIVIAVVAILAAVLIPTFVNIVDKANESSDMQAVREMNLALENSEALSGKPSSVSEAMDILEAENLDARNYKALSKNHVILYNFKANVVVYLNLTTNKIEYPNGLDLEYGDATIGEWYKLDGRMQGDTTWQTAATINRGDAILQMNADGTYPEEKQTSGVIKEGDTIVGAKVDTAAKLVSVVEYIESESSKNEKFNFTLILGADIDMLNSEWKPISKYNGSFYGNGHKISNMQISDFTAEAKPYSANTDDSAYYYYGFISVFTGEYFGDITFEDVVIDRPGHTMTLDEKGAARNNHTVGGAIGGIVLSNEDFGTEKTVTVKNVTVTGSIHAYRRGGGIVGYIGGYNKSSDFNASQMNCTVNIENCTNDADITTDAETTFGTIGGILSTTNQRQANAKINITGCTNSGILSGVRVGGMIGDVHVSSSENGGAITINECYNTGEISVIRVQANNNALKDAWNAAGGIFGFVQGGYNYTLTITGCENSGNVVDKSGYTAGYVYLGSIIGSGDLTIKAPVTMSKNTNTVTISGDPDEVNNKLNGTYNPASSGDFKAWLKAA